MLNILQTTENGDAHSDVTNSLSFTTMDQEITVQFRDGHVRVDIEDVDADMLVDHFGLPFRPSVLLRYDAHGGKKLVPLAKRNKLVPGATYHIQDKNPEGGAVGGASLVGAGSSLRSSSPGSPFHRREASGRRSRVSGRLWASEDLPEVVQNAVVCSKAVYAEDDRACERFLTENVANHGLSPSVSRSRHGECCFLIAEEELSAGSSSKKAGGGRVYVAFRGTRTKEDWKDNLRAYQVEGNVSCTAKAIRGKVHSGFLDRAAQFPVEKLLSDESLRDREIVLCGHSLGGAIATIVAVMMMVDVEKKRKAGFGADRAVTCVTFGAPLVGDEDLRAFCDEHGISKNLFHFVSDGDPVPRVLSYAQCLSALSCQIDNQVRSLLSTFSTREGATFYEDKKRTWIQKKETYMEVLSRVIPAVEPILETAAILCPKYSGVLTTAKLGTSLVHDLVTASHNGHAGASGKRPPYVNIGNYLFATNENSTPIALEFHDVANISRCFEMPLDGQLSQTVQEIPVRHAVENYEEFVAVWGECAGEFEEGYSNTVLVAGEAVVDYALRRVEVEERYTPEISSAELVRVQSRHKDILRLRVTGCNLFDIVLEQCQFNFGFPFGRSKDKAVVKKMPLGTKVERVIFEEDYAEAPAISDHGTTILLATRFGDCQYLMNKGQFRNLVIPSVNEISHHESISVLIRRAVQRGLAVAQIRRSMNQTSWKPVKEKIIQEVIKLARLTLDKAYFEDMYGVFEDTSKSVQFVLSNESEFERIQCFCDRIQMYLRKPLQIEAEKSIARKIGIGTASLLGGATLAYLAGPGMVLIGAVEAASFSAAGVAGALGSVGAGLVTHGLLSDRMADENYEQVLSFVTLELFKKLQGASESEIGEEEGEEKCCLLQEVSDLREDGGTFSLEKALLLMYNPEHGIDNFNGCDLQNCTKESKLSVINRIECIKTVHSIRSILAKQCYIGVVGLQDAGKTTFLHKLWGIGGPTGHFRHTDVPSIYEIEKRLLVVDFPGSNSLDYHAKTFSICGAMNNLIVIVIPYTGDISELASQEVSRVFEVMAGSESTQIVLCVNKCGYELPGAIRREMAGVQDPIDALRQRFAGRLNDHYENTGSGFSVSKDRIFFTDWLSEEAREVGICGVAEIRREIRKYLMDNNIYGQDEEALLDKCLSRDFPAKQQQQHQAHHL